jgi:hypothetical protein
VNDEELERIGRTQRGIVLGTILAFAWRTEENHEKPPSG